MSYDIHIVRLDKAHPITRDEFYAYITAASDLYLDTSEIIEVLTQAGQVLRTPNPGSAYWRDKARLFYNERRGHIYARSPSEDVIRRMLTIARALDAVVVGDEGERYDWLQP